jgi:hypothetical protein
MTDTMCSMHTFLRIAIATQDTIPHPQARAAAPTKQGQARLREQPTAVAPPPCADLGGRAESPIPHLRPSHRNGDSVPFLSGEHEFVVIPVLVRGRIARFPFGAVHLAVLGSGHRCCGGEKAATFSGCRASIRRRTTVAVLIRKASEGRGWRGATSGT